MASIYDIPYEDIRKFLLANDINFKKSLVIPQRDFGSFKTLNKNEKEAYNIARNLFKDNIPNYTIYEVDKMSQIEIGQLAKSLTLKGNDVGNIKNILRYLHKLDETVNINTNKNLTIAGEAIYNIILSNMDNKTINRMNINKYSKLSLERSFI